MLILLSSGEFLSLFIGWELVSWASYLIMAHYSNKAADAAFRYLIYAMSGAMAVMAAIVLISVKVGSLEYNAFWAAFPNLSTSTQWALVLLLGGGFSVKIAMMPFHLWQADAYAETPGANAAFISATPMGVAGGLLHVFNYATYQIVLFLAVTAVLYRAGTTDLDRLGGLIVRMPLTYVALLMGIIGLAGLPPMNGFVSKWLIYKALLESEMPLLLVAASISTLGTILSVYKLIHNIFLGQLRKEHYKLKEVPWTMSVPMLALAGIAFLTGAMPGLSLELVDKAQIALGYTPIAHHLGGVIWHNGSLNMLLVTGVFFYGVGIGAIIFFLGNPRFITHQWDNYAGGHFLSADTPYNFTHNFYPGVMRVIGPWFKGTIVKLEQGFIHLAQILAGAFHSFYRLSYTPLYLLIVTVLTLAWMFQSA